MFHGHDRKHTFQILKIELVSTSVDFTNFEVGSSSSMTQTATMGMNIQLSVHNELGEIAPALFLLTGSHIFWAEEKELLLILNNLHVLQPGQDFLEHVLVSH